MVVETDNKPIIQCRPKKMDNVYMGWSGDAWRLLGPIEGINGILMGGFSASILFTVASWVRKSRIIEQEFEPPSRTSKSKADDLHEEPDASHPQQRPVTEEQSP